MVKIPNAILLQLKGIEHVSQLVRHFTEIEYRNFQNDYSVLGGDLEARITNIHTQILEYRTITLYQLNRLAAVSIARTIFVVDSQESKLESVKNVEIACEKLILAISAKGMKGSKHSHHTETQIQQSIRKITI